MSCTKCALHKQCWNSLIWGRGSKPNKTKYMIILERPSRSDDSANQALTGDTQMKLSYFLKEAGLKRDEVYVTYALKCKPKETSDIKKTHLETCRDYLFSEIIKHRPKVLIPMGRWAFQAVSDKTSIREFRGHFTFEDFELDYEKLINGKEVERKITAKIIPTWSLLGSLAKWEYNPDIISDFKKAKLYVEQNTIHMSKEPELNVILTKKGLRDFVEKYREVTHAATDFETTGFEFFKDQIINAGYATKDGISDILYLTPYKKEHFAKFNKAKNKWLPVWDKENIQRAREINSFLKHHREDTLKALKTVNSFKNLKLILHNGKFDSKFAIKNKIPYKNFWFDTLVADSLIDENLGHSLNIAMERRNINYGAYDTLLWKYTNKDEKKKKSYQHIPPYLLERYLGIDTYGDYQLFEAQVKELKREGMVNHFFKRKMPILREITKMEYIGVKADKKLFDKTAKKIQKTQDKLHKELEEITGIEGFNPNSPKQIVDYMVKEGYPFKKLKIKETKTGFSTGKDELSKFLKFKKYKKFPELILNTKKLMKIRGTYVDGNNSKKKAGGLVQYLDPKNRIHTNYNIWTPRTSRYSSNAPSLQVWPRPIKGLPNMRNAVIPTNKDWCLFEADYSQLEMCVVSALSKDPVLTQRIQDGMDLHCINAADLGRILQTVPDWVTYEHMLITNDKENLIKDKDIIPELLKDIEKFGKDINWKEERTGAKNIGFGLSYGKTAITFAEDFNIAVEEAEEMVDAYFEIYNVMRDWRNDQVEKALTQGYVNLLSERKRRFHHGVNWINSHFAEDLWSAKKTRQEISRQAMNSPVQGGAHDVFEPALLRLLKRFRKEGLRARLMLLIHDGIVGECPIEEREMVNKCVLEEMPTILNEGTEFSLNLKVDCDYYKWEWYGEKIKI